MKFNIKLLTILILILSWGCKDPCKDQICLNGGTCVEGDCVCPNGYSGANCETVDLCAGITCFNNGVCVNGACECPPGYSGTNCQSADPCADINCLNNGVCISGICNCLPGYSGVYCQNYDPCFGVTCLNGGTCLSGDCLCPTGYTGVFCEIELLPNAFRIEQIELNEFPESNGASCWDNDGTCYGDIYWIIKDGNTNVLVSGYKTDCTSPNNYIYTTNLPITLSYATTYTLQLWDYDGTGTNPDLVANTNLTLSDIYSPPLPTSTLTLSNGIISFKFRGNWIF